MYLRKNIFWRQRKDCGDVMMEALYWTKSQLYFYKNIWKVQINLKKNKTTSQQIKNLLSMMYLLTLIKFLLMINLKLSLICLIHMKLILYIIRIFYSLLLYLLLFNNLLISKMQMLVLNLFIWILEISILIQGKMCLSSHQMIVVYSYK